MPRCCSKSRAPAARSSPAPLRRWSPHPEGHGPSCGSTFRSAASGTASGRCASSGPAAAASSRLRRPRCATSSTSSRPAGPIMSRMPDSRRYYTGDAINPLVIVRYSNGGWPEDMNVIADDHPAGRQRRQLRSAPPASKPPGLVDGDIIPARQATLKSIEASTGNPVVNYVDTTIALSDEPGLNGSFESGGLFGRPLPDLLTWKATTRSTPRRNTRRAAPDSASSSGRSTSTSESIPARRRSARRRWATARTADPACG